LVYGRIDDFGEKADPALSSEEPPTYHGIFATYYSLGTSAEKAMPQRTAIDSNAFTYLVEAVSPEYDPTFDNPQLASERIAMLRAILYGGIQFSVVPTVEQEVSHIPDEVRLRDHQGAAFVMFLPVTMQVSDEVVCTRVSALQAHHPRYPDCRIVAEAELAGLETLVTNDKDLIHNLSGQSRIRLMKPSDYFETLGIAAGSDPVWEPERSNPLFKTDRWNL
jgi:predicted nucleic acid-binding protein